LPLPVASGLLPRPIYPFAGRVLGARGYCLFGVLFRGLLGVSLVLRKWSVSKTFVFGTLGQPPQNPRV